MHSSRSVAKIRYKVRPEINSKIRFMQADITTLKIDAITNAANETLLGGGGVDGAIHRAAGPKLLEECKKLKGCKTGNAKITKGYNLPAKYVIHTVGPIGENPTMLKSCYASTLKVAKERGVKSIAFPCISTGIYGYPNEKAAHVALGTVREWLEENHKNMKKIIFCLFMEVDIECYQKLKKIYFPESEDDYTSFGVGDKGCQGSSVDAAPEEECHEKKSDAAKEPMQVEQHSHQEEIRDSVEDKSNVAKVEEMEEIKDEKPAADNEDVKESTGDDIAEEAERTGEEKHEKPASDAAMEVDKADSAADDEFAQPTSCKEDSVQSACKSEETKL